MNASTRRAALGAILAAPLASVPAAASVPSDLARACEWGVAHLAWINENDEPHEAWPDERLHRELDRVDDVLWRVADEPARDRTDLVAKVRLILASDGEMLSLSDSADDRALSTVLQEVLALCA